MPAIANNDVFEVTMFSKYQDQYVLNVFHYIYSGPGVAAADYTAQLNAVATDFYSKRWLNVLTGIKRGVVEDFVLERIRVQKIYPTREYYIDKLVNNPGDLIEAGVPVNSALTMSYPTDRAIRGATGSKRFTGLPLSGLDGGDWSGATLTQWNIIGTGLADYISGVDLLDVYFPTVWSPKRPADRATILSVYARSEVRTQHRRTKGLGI